jgi:hypothetical protein
VALAIPAGLALDRRFRSALLTGAWLTAAGVPPALIWLAGNAGGIVVAVLVQATQGHPSVAFSLLAGTVTLVLAFA